MADNYLENKMEEHRRAAAGALPRRYSPLGRKRGTVSFDLGEKSVFIVGCERSCAVARAVITAMGEAGFRVAFVWDDIKNGRSLAQTTSTRHYPFADVEKARAMVLADRGSIDIDIEVHHDRLDMIVDGKSLTIASQTSETDFAASVGEAALYLLLPWSCRLGISTLNVGE